MEIIKKYWVIVLALIIGFSSCEEDPIKKSDVVKEKEILMNAMESWYLWYDKLPDVNINDYSDVYTLLDALKYKEKDKWSFIMTKEQFSAVFQEGSYTGFGYSSAYDGNGDLRILFLYANSPLAENGVTRGWIIKEINGTTITPNMNTSNLTANTSIPFKLQDLDGAIHEFTVQKKEIFTNSVLHSNVIDLGTKKVGHLVFESFIEPSFEELATVFANFKSQNIDELVVDLRYNGGGMLSVAKDLAGYIIPQNLEGKAFTKLAHNDKHLADDEVDNLVYNANSANLDKVYFITTGNSASASESLINGLEPYMDVYLIGRTTHGKPVGMYSLSTDASDYVYLPIAFRVENSVGFYDYFNGLPVDITIQDDVTRDFSDPNEACLAQALYHIKNGSFNTSKAYDDGLNIVNQKEANDFRGLIINR